MKTLAALLAICVVSYLALRLRPATPARVRGIERGAVVRVGRRRWVVVRVQVALSAF